ncbi:MAG: glycosyltransferase [Candidatus Levybacteria bacterium]|nr:glycosyltransferase [Candidatus Levybacteria bacterium]
MKLSKPTISFFCPAYNDEKNLPILIPKVVKLLKKIASKFEIIIIEDGSPDKTGEVADRLARKNPKITRVVHHKKNLGYGAALRKGFKEANKYDFVFFTDGDNQFDVNELEKFVPFFSLFDAVVGYRTNRALNFMRIVQTFIFNYLIRILFGVKVKDINCSMKVIKKSVLNKLDLKSNSSFIEAEFFIKLKREKAKVKELGVSHYPRTHGVASGGKPVVVLNTLKDMFIFWWKFNKSKLLKILPYLLLCIWVLFSYLKVFYGLFAVWESGITEAWYLKNGLVIYRDYIHHHTPLLRYILFLFFEIIGYQPFTLQIFSFLISILLFIFVFITARSVSKQISLITSIIFILLFFSFFTNFHLEEGTSGLFILISVFLSFLFIDKKKLYLLFLSGLFAGFAVMTKQTSVGIMFAVGLTLLFIKENNFKKNIFGIFIFGLGSLFAILPILYYFYSKEALSDFFYYNVIFNLTIYREKTTAYALAEGVRVSLPLLFSLFPLSIFLYKKQLKNKILSSKILLLFLSIVFLTPVLLPSFLGGRLLPLFPLAIISWGFILNWILRYKENKLRLLYIFILIVSSGFIFSEVPYVKNQIIAFPREFSQKTLLFDYTENDLKVAQWLRENTDKDQKIYNMGNSYINFLSQRLPQNRYVFMLPWLVMPFDKSTKDIISNPPEIVINDVYNDIDPMLKSWGFLKYLKENYIKKEQYGNIVIYIKK